MDKFLYIAMSGAKQGMNALAVSANNLANANTDGFKADMVQARSMQAFGEGLPTRVFSMLESPGSNFNSGPIKTTGRDLDIAVKGDGWLAVQAADGSEAYTRAGSLKIDSTGLLLNSRDRPVMGASGPIVLPIPVEKIEISANGIISVRPQGATAEVIEEVGRIKLVNPGNENLMRGEDGLFRLIAGGNAPNDPGVQVESGAVEGSNVNSVHEMVAMIDIQRQYEMQVKMMKNAEEIDRASTSLMRIS
ncbi:MULTISPECIES: flagellar basal-body rod protein FlgF [Shewanella]|uniref:flagellar basal-body rod protein FlgF n=1 Tax=Shewanella TaxID=22 RepID=UPI000C490940|nr:MULTISPECIES: flagellar basal-body rod protein FlgF [Shewanella]NCQ45530.1 flagellar basal-body rod protein FlgF [Shewanella frigidimarina]NCO73431.1 flagellar basal-body rod protein FlgF [Shewanella vesiculosa]NCP37578.1 flagellar basal-body rod protein FlgF [Shewanella vesiculosa]NCP69308.1 flagellar basal-body rod protein FlgF [Shewanella vesiculosa]NCP75199.1 flagellar basal-body rod protein FlgF [Shewanella vesiculosa]|tara:strand:+ start:800 stop:1543 length:744 start_codon:yes stop_codon:yes gene_type:complete